VRRKRPSRVGTMIARIEQSSMDGLQNGGKIKLKNTRPPLLKLKNTGPPLLFPSPFAPELSPWMDTDGRCSLAGAKIHIMPLRTRNQPITQVSALPAKERGANSKPLSTAATGQKPKRYSGTFSPRRIAAVSWVKVCA